ncbi:DUF3986 family protein [Bacillus sp. FJAT-42376]|uniref:DUF3986 family protein n=1 Tax=Bacillus sp. FJAT-42376 TaxID=2014076 RepID=UPI000F4F11C3|nr:DUF3986 family protein [Bacillus sp. FJAT-42376]AZB43471.1 DUF3986 family protein [Bacillus sp. FJAT-42376]
MLYDSRYHLHIGYYEKGLDFEAVAYKRELEDIWDVFFDFKFYNLKIPYGNRNFALQHVGIRIFSVKESDLDYDVGAQKFEEWLRSEQII